MVIVSSATSSLGMSLQVAHLIRSVYTRILSPEKEAPPALDPREAEEGPLPYQCLGAGGLHHDWDGGHEETGSDSEQLSSHWE